MEKKVLHRSIITHIPQQEEDDLDTNYAYWHTDSVQKELVNDFEYSLAIRFSAVSLQFHYFFYLQLNLCNGTLKAIEKTLSVLWNAFNVEMDQPISHCISQCAIQIH